MRQDKESLLSQVPIVRRIFSIPTLLSFGVAAGVILFLATRFDLDWGETWRGILDINPWFYLLAFALYYMSFIFRGMRWKMLATNAAESSSDETQVPSTLHTSQLIVIGWFVNSVTWLRMGDAYRAYAFAADSKSSFSWSLGTLLAERVMDMVI
ncbi:MAG: flippase-like domain-containing protein, partial [Dehalococcoidia bacterium]|nr:flippase-like domain-containing protein [Dehalococcoidia bacterium]